MPTRGDLLRVLHAPSRYHGTPKNVSLSRNIEARRIGTQGSLERSDGERSLAQRGADQPEAERKRPGRAPNPQRDNGQQKSAQTFVCA